MKGLLREKQPLFLGICALRRSGGVVSGTVSDERLGQQYDTGHGQVKPPYHAETKPAQKRVDKYYQRQKQVHDTAGQHQSGSGTEAFRRALKACICSIPLSRVKKPIANVSVLSNSTEP